MCHPSWPKSPVVLKKIWPNGSLEPSLGVSSPSLGNPGSTTGNAFYSDYGPIYIQRLRRRCDIVPKSHLLFWCCTVTPSVCDCNQQSLGNRFVSHSGATSQMRRRLDVNGLYTRHRACCQLIVNTFPSNSIQNCLFYG